MIILIIGSLLLGAILGRFFNVLVLAPAFALSLAMVAASFAYFGHGLLRPLLEFAVLITSLQIGDVSRHAFVFGSPACRNAGEPVATSAPGAGRGYFILRKGWDAYLRTL